ncbi:MAG: flavin reductase family protein [Betaproteobacteria bacterium]|jgi:flavin reductase (DIM6/NTAB) family NADH-FMN oxidoreductase RutF
MDLLLKDLSTTDRYKFLSAVVVPRPVAFVTSRNEAGLHNAAPFSFFNVFSEDPAIVVLGISTRPSGRIKDTVTNIRDTKKFVVNMVDRSIIGAMHIASAEIPSDESEIDYAGIDLVDCQVIDVKRIKQAPVSLECQLFQTIELSERRSLILGEVLAIHIDDAIMDLETKRLIPEKYSPIARLYGDYYAWLGDRYTKAIPTMEEIRTLGLRAGDIKE